LAPLALAAYTDIQLTKLLSVHIDGIPLQLAAKLLPSKSKLSPMLYGHIHLHAKTQLKHSKDGENDATIKKRKVSKTQLEGLILSLAKLTNKFEWKPKGTEWGDYYSFTNYSDKSFEQKKKIIQGFIKQVKPKKVLDIGANNGLFSRIASDQGIPTVALDIDPISVEKNYRQVVKDGEEFMLPLVNDLTNPSPAIGWANTERDSINNRLSADMVLCLALIHHLSISNNLPLEYTSDFLADIGEYVVMEFVPKGDSKVNILLASREDIFPDYTEVGFEKAYSKNFKILDKKKVTGSKRTLYLLKKK
jgi:hypothetical protein